MYRASPSFKYVRKPGVLVKNLHKNENFPDSTVSLFIQVGDREDSNVYIRMKMKNAAEVGIAAQHVKLPRTTTHRQLLDELERLNNDDTVHGIILQVGALDMTPFTQHWPWTND